LGLGSALLGSLGVGKTLGWAERAGWSFAIGFGVLGWLLFFAGALGLFNTPALLALLAAGTPGLVFLGRPTVQGGIPPEGTVARTLLVLLAIAFAFDFMEVLSPPADADTMAYHFALPKQMLAAGRLEFVPRALDGAIPLLVQMTYVPALGLGGENAVTLWTFVSGWGLAFVFYLACRRHLETSWSLATTLILVTTPAVVYGAGAGQVEVRLALFATLAALAAGSARGSDHPGFFVLAGIAAGFFMGAKYTGLFFVAACGLVMIPGRDWIKRGVLFGGAALVAGSQWYGWNWYHSGDPVFPMLFGWLDYGDTGFWDIAHAEHLRKAFFGEEQGAATTPRWFLLYPFVATLDGLPQFESGRVGLGPFGLLVLPFMAAGLWHFREHIAASPLTPAVAIVVLFYALWFFIGSSQRVRHLVPVLPLVLLAVTVAARRWCAISERLRPLAAAAALTIAVQIGGHCLFSLNYIRHVLSGESREAFLRRNIGEYAAVEWINAELTPEDRVFLEYRPLNYLIDVPIYYASAVGEALVDIRPTAQNPTRFYHQLRRLGVTHLLVMDSDLDSVSTMGGQQWRGLVKKGCAVTVKSLRVETKGSRTLPTMAMGKTTILILRLEDSSCLV